MEEKINVAEILKDKPQGTKLYSILSDGECFLNEASEDSIHIDIDNRKRFWCFSAYGSTHSFPNGCVLLFPSKEMRDWSKFSWKKGDVLVSNDSDSHIIFKGFSKNDYTTFEGKHWISVSKKRHVSCLEMQNVQDYHIEDNKDSAQTYISTIEERLGGKLNRETLEIEKYQPEFKDGDVVVVDEIPFDLYSKCIFILKENLNTGEIKARAYVLYNVNKDSIFFDTPIMKVIERNIHLATEEEKQQLFDALAKEGKAWDAEKKQIVDLKPKFEFKPFDKVLCRNSKDDTWEADFFARLTRKEIDYTQSGKYLCVGDLWMYCIPYNEETAHLLGTTDEWKGGEG